MKTSTFLLVAGLVAVLPLSASAKIERVVEKTFSVQPGGTFKAETQGGDIRVEPGTGDIVKVVAKQKIRANTDADADDLLKDLTLTIEQQGNDVVAIAKYPDKPFGFHIGSWPPVQVDFIVTVPSRFNTDLHTSGGDITVGNLAGTMFARTSGGDVKVGQIDGTVDVNTSGGDVQLTSCSGATKLRTSGGDVTAERIAGPADLGTSGGDIVARHVENTLQAHTSGGDIEAGIFGALQGDCSLGTSGGDVTVTIDKSVTCQLDAATSGGAVQAAGLTITLENGGVGKSRLAGKVNGGGPLLKLRTSGGEIDVRLR